MDYFTEVSWALDESPGGENDPRNPLSSPSEKRRTSTVWRKVGQIDSRPTSQCT